MKIGVDIDGVLADFVSAHSEVIFQQTGVRLPPVSDEWPDVWDYDKKAGLTSRQRTDVWKEISTTTFWAMLQPLPGTIEALERLNTIAKAGNEVYYITSRPGSQAKFYSEVWLRWHGAEFPTVIVSSEKGHIAKGLGLNVMIEDKPENLVDVAMADGGADGDYRGRLYLIDRPYNQGLTALGVNGVGYIRVRDINEVLDIEFPRTRLKEAA